MQLCDEFDCGFGWLQDERMQRASHALVAGGRVWAIDPVDEDGLDERLLALGEPGGVIQLLDRHNRDSAALAARLGVPLHYLDAPAPFEAIRLGTPPKWNEIALWWPERRVLVCADALGTAPFFRAGDEPVGVHPMLRFAPPRALVGLGPEHVLVGHGEGLHGPETGALVDDAVRQARRRIPRWLRGIPRIVRRGY
jgi:hypothetical protein